MPDYETMYHKLLLEMNNTIDRFKNKLLETEEMYLSVEDAESALCKEAKAKESHS